MPCGVGREGLAWRGKAGWVPTKAGLVDRAGAGLVNGNRPRWTGVREAGQGLGGGVQGLRFRGGRW